MTQEQWISIAVSAIPSALILIFLMGRKDAALARVAEAIGEIGENLVKHRKEVAESASDHRREVDVRFAGTSAQIRTIETQASEARENAARIYATNETVRAIEARFSTGQDKLLVAVDKVGDRVNEINNRMLDDAQREHKR